MSAISPISAVSTVAVFSNVPVEGFVVGQWNNLIKRLLRHRRVASTHSDRRLLWERIRTYST